METVQKLIRFFDRSPGPFGACRSIREELLENGYTEVEEGNYTVVKGGKYFLTRNDTSVMAFAIGSSLKDPSLQVTASHTDSPLLKLKPNALCKDKGKACLNVEVYGGPILHPWFDRPLGLTGRVLYKNDGVIVSEYYQSKAPFALIPSIAPHLARDRNDIDLKVDLQALVSLDENFSLERFLEEELSLSEGTLLSYDLFLYPFDSGRVWGPHSEFFSVNHIDDLECAYTCLQGFLNASHEDNINVYLAFDNEEVGSLTRQGADSDLFETNLRRIEECLGIAHDTLVHQGMMLSCDNGHAIHPNHPEFSDKVNAPVMNGGVVIKSNARQSYTSDGIGIALLKDLMDRKEIPYQFYTNRSDLRGGGTLGNIALHHVSILSVDIGLAQLAMHSPIETAGTKDIDAMISLIRAFYTSHYHNSLQGVSLV